MTELSNHDDDDVSRDLSGQFLKQADFEDGTGKVFTIARVERTHFEERNGRPEEWKWVLTFDDDRSLGLNKTNLKLCMKFFGKFAKAWVGQKIVVYRDETVQMSGSFVGGLRVRKPTKAELTVDDIPF